MLESIESKIICNLKRAHPLIEKRETMQIREFMEEYILKNIENKRPKFKFNKKLFIKSLLSSLKFKKASPSCFNKNNNIFISKNNPDNIKNEILNAKKIIINDKKLKRASSYHNANEENNYLKEIFNIKSNKKFINKNIEPNTENNFFFKPFNDKNRLYLSAKNLRKINNNRYNQIIYSLKDNNNNYHNILLLSAKRNSENYKSANNSSIKDKSYKSMTSIKSISNGQSNKSSQSSFNVIYKKIKRNYGNENLMNRNDRKLDEDNNKFLKINKTYFKQKSLKQQYLRFLEKKSLALRANFIMNNIQDSRGGKQELRYLYNPLNV